ncbi:hypothetical protein BDN67DRAFT_157414 [Paxillus ammoniavirescens]|nr:hypothetical protein BDN67DRAFT_157414 [Paxillus ammoniavirescens]
MPRFSPPRTLLVLVLRGCMVESYSATTPYPIQWVVKRLHQTFGATFPYSSPLTWLVVAIRWIRTIHPWHPLQEDQTLAQRTRPGDATTLRSNAAPRLRKQYKIAKIRQTLLDMLRDIDFPLRNNYLPWSSLEGDLRKHGYEITNWPSGVLRENDKGINALTARNVNKLYFALTQANGEGRPRFVGCVDRSTDQDEVVTQVQNMASSKRRLENDHHDGKGKRTRFEAVRTAEYYTGHGTEG